MREDGVGSCGYGKIVASKSGTQASRSHSPNL